MENIITRLNAYLPLKDRGGVWKSQCPFHGGDEESIEVQPQTQTWRCVVCGRNGDGDSFAKQYEEDFVRGGS